MMPMGLMAVPPVSSPTRMGQLSERVFLVADTKVIKSGLVGSMPAYARVGRDHEESPTRFRDLILIEYCSPGVNPVNV